ncbi:hypothetical protein C8R41DRAFT_927307 [Lentinula lateritia]|uniref:DDE-1 domain-containing protein n=1 Tax=Lentinula lateritia TaxID=40482 RepID=A0ABQ8UZX7_9AGAR|nr:hypothetical protein C8R41DRAFT_927307 [Lentinula lateritia]
MKKADWSAQDAVKALQRDNPTLYEHLHCGTVWKWKEKDARAWSEKTREKVKNHHALLGSGRAGALTKHPELVEEIKTTLSSLCTSGFVWENIPPKLVINGNQQGIFVLPSSSKTYNTKGDSDILPFQCVWAGKTAASLPSKDAPGMEKALGHGFCFTVAASEKSPRSHFSTLKTMKEYITDIIMPYVKSVIAADPDLNNEQKAVLYIDVYPVHTSKPFRTFVYTGFPNLVIVFVPANCTGKYEPANLAAGAKPEEIKVTTSLPKLRDASVAGLVKAYEYMQLLDGRDLIKKAWAKSTTSNGYNLSAECLTSRESHAALSKYLMMDQTLHHEIEAWCGKVLRLDDGTAVEGNTDFGCDQNEDADVPFDELVAETFSEQTQE